MLEEALRDYLLSKSAVTTITSTRVFVGLKHFIETTDLPAVTIERPFAPKAEREQTLDGTEVNLQFPEFEFVSHALLREDSILLANKVRRCLHSIRNGTSIVVDDPEGGADITVTIEQVDVLHEWDDQEEDIGHGNTDRPRVIRARVGWRETVTGL